jgi:serine/threonine protein kinase
LDTAITISKVCDYSNTKDENILINTKTREIRLIDFGSTTQLIPGKSFELFYGTKKFASPQAIHGDPYDPAAQEVWCLGTLLYVLIFKMDPFKDDLEIAKLDISGRVDRLRACGRRDGGADVSQNGRDALVRLLHKDHRRRIQCSDILDLPYLK